MKELLLIAAIILGTNANAQPVQREVDRFTQETKLSVDLEMAQQPNPYSVLPTKVIVTANKGAGPISYSALIATNSSIGRGGAGGWRYLGVDSIDWLVDGQPAAFDKVAAQRQVAGRAVAEYFIQPFTREQVERLASSTTVEFRIGTDEFALSPAQILAIADLTAQAASLNGETASQ
jgi:hypothetical protein